MTIITALTSGALLIYRYMNDMRKLTTLFLMFSAVICAFVGCDDGKTYAEKIEDESRAIDRFVDDKGWVVTEEYPTGKFKENVYFKHSSGCYFHVIDSGNGVRPTFRQEVLVRHRGRLLFMSDSLRIGGNWYSPLPIEFVKGAIDPNSYVVPQAWDVAMDFVGDGAMVSMLVPSMLSVVDERNNVEPSYYDTIQFRLY